MRRRRRAGGEGPPTGPTAGPSLLVFRDQVYNVRLTATSNTCGTTNPAPVTLFIRPQQSGSTLLVHGLLSGPVPASLDGGRLTFRVPVQGQGGAAVVQADWRFPDEHSFRGTTAVEVTPTGGKACAVTYDAVGTHEMPTGLPPGTAETPGQPGRSAAPSSSEPLALSAPPAPAAPFPVWAAAGPRGAAAPTLAPTLASASAALDGAGLPPHFFTGRCVGGLAGSRPYAINAGPADFGNWPGANNLSIGGFTAVDPRTGAPGVATSFGIAGGQMLYFRAVAGWYGTDNQWHYEYGSWIRSFNTFYLNVERYQNGRWERLDPGSFATLSGHIIASQLGLSFPGQYWLGGYFYWGPIEGTNFTGHLHFDWASPQVTCG